MIVAILLGCFALFGIIICNVAQRQAPSAALPLQGLIGILSTVAALCAITVYLGAI